MAEKPVGSGHMPDFTRKPLLVYWEVTRACELACRHCRAEANPIRHPEELTPEEGQKLLHEIAEFAEAGAGEGHGPRLPHLVITGGDPLKRPDLWEIVGTARKLGFATAITPSGTYALTEPIVKRFVDEGIWMMAVSIDGSTPDKHDGIRMVPGSFEQTVQAAKWARDAKIPFQVNTLVCDQTADDLKAIYDVITGLGADRWSLFFLIQVGRGKGLTEVTPERGEELMQLLLDLAAEEKLDIKTTEAPHYRRLAIEREKAGDYTMPAGLRRGFGIRDGCGVMFISHIGEVYPAGFLPLVAGNVRDTSPVELYRNAPIFKQIRDMDSLQGKCGICEYRYTCGGSRSRALAYTGDMMESDPLCPYQPGQ